MADGRWAQVRVVDAGRMAGTDDLDATCTHLVLDPEASAKSPRTTATAPTRDESVTVCLAWGQPSAARMDECSQRGHLVVRPDFIFHCIKWREDCRLLLGELQNDPTYMWSS